MASYSYWSGEHYFYHTEIVDLIKTIEIERNAKRDNNVKIDTTFAYDLMKALGPAPVE